MDLKINLPDWVYGFIELGWMRHKEMVKDPSLCLTNVFPFLEGERFDSFEEYALAVIEGLVRAYYEGYKKGEAEALKSLDETILARANRLAERNLSVDRKG